MSAGTWGSGFGDSYKVPAAIDKLVHLGGLEDSSRPDDVSPRFTVKGSTVELWVGHPVPYLREMTVHRYELGDAQDSGSWEGCYSGDSLQELLGFLLVPDWSEEHGHHVRPIGGDDSSSVVRQLPTRSAAHMWIDAFIKNNKE